MWFIELYIGYRFVIDFEKEMEQRVPSCYEILNTSTMKYKFVTYL